MVGTNYMAETLLVRNITKKFNAQNPLNGL